jgi:DNA-binding transcriptional ArsR family regulator
MFRTEQILVPLYDAISRQAVLAADADRVAGFLGKKITPQLAQEVGLRLSTRIEGRCIKHYMGAAGVKVYDKFSRVLRVETTVNDLSSFEDHRKVHITPSAMSRQLRRLRMLGLIKTVSHTYRYYLTRVGRAAIAAAYSLTRFNIVPAMAATH